MMLERLLYYNKDMSIGELLPYVNTLMTQNYRLVQICATKLGENRFEINYSFDRDYELANVRLVCDQQIEIPSITCIYLAAFLYENEINELFGLKITNIKIDFDGHLYKKAVAHPFDIAVAKQEN